MNDARPNKAHEHARVARMTHHGVRTGCDELVLLANALLIHKVWTEGAVALDADEPACCEENPAEDERDGQLAGLGGPERIQDCRNGVGRPWRVLQRVDDDH